MHKKMFLFSKGTSEIVKKFFVPCTSVLTSIWILTLKLKIAKLILVCSDWSLLFGSLLSTAPPASQPRWRYPNSPEPKRARKFHVSLNHTPFESRTSQKAPYAPRATLGGSTTLRGKEFSPAVYNSLSDPHLNPYFSRKFGKSASLRESGVSKSKVCDYKINSCLVSWVT